MTFMKDDSKSNTSTITKNTKTLSEKMPNSIQQISDQFEKLTGSKENSQEIDILSLLKIPSIALEVSSSITPNNEFTNTSKEISDAFKDHLSTQNDPSFNKKFRAAFDNYLHHCQSACQNVSESLRNKVPITQLVAFTGAVKRLAVAIVDLCYTLIKGVGKITLAPAKAAYMIGKTLFESSTEIVEAFKKVSAEWKIVKESALNISTSQGMNQKTSPMRV